MGVVGGYGDDYLAFDPDELFLSVNFLDGDYPLYYVYEVGYYNEDED